MWGGGETIVSQFQRIMLISSYVGYMKYCNDGTTRKPQEKKCLVICFSNLALFEWYFGWGGKIQAAGQAFTSNGKNCLSCP